MTRQLITQRPIRFAIVGCGRIAQNHIEAIRSLGADAELVAVCDTNAERRAAIGKAVQAPAFGSLTELLADDPADVYSICTPSGLHPHHVCEVAATGKDVITEKPMATRWEDGLRMVNACDAAGSRLFVVKQNRLNATLQRVRSAIRERRFGRIHMVHVNVFWTRPQEYYDADEWRGTWEYDGGALMNQASHYVDLLDWLIGPVESVQAMVATRARDIEVEDTAVLNVRWRTGTLGSMAVTMTTFPKNLEGSITILGDTGTVRVGGVAVNEITHWQFAEPRPEDDSAFDSSYATESVYGKGHSAYYRNVLECLRGVAPAGTDGREGLRSLELLIAAYVSARDGRQVSLPLRY